MADDMTGHARSSWSVQAHLAVLVLALLLPILLFTGFILHQFAAVERVRYQATALDVARRITVSVDREMSGIQTALQVLSGSRSVEFEDNAGIRREAGQLRSLLGAAIVVKGVDGRLLVDPGGPHDEAVAVALTPVERKAASTGAPAVSDLIVANGRATISVTVPVIRDATVTHLLGVEILPNRIADVLAAENLPPDWTAAVVDSQWRILARSRMHDRFVGTYATEDLRRHAVGPEGTWTGVTAEGTPVLSAYTGSSPTGWRVAVGVPVAAIERPLRESLEWLTTFGLVALLASAALAYGFGRRLAAPIDRLRGDALLLGQARFRAGDTTGLREVDEVRAALERASDDLLRRAEERDRAEAALKAFAGRLEQLVADRTRDLVESNRKLLGEVEQRERVEEQLRHAQKMEAMGQLTGGIAHDFNNLLAIILGSLQMLKRRLARAEHDRIDVYVDGAIDGANRAAALTRRLLAFARRQPLSPEPVDVNRLIEGMSDLLGRTLGEQVRIETDYAADLWMTHADPNQLENAVLNLAVNARDAMPEGGTLTLRTANVDGAAAIALHLDADGVASADAADGYVCLEVADTGTGMRPEVAARAFDPFFTTKPTGRGTGLGLSQVYGFVRQTGGEVRIETEPGRGSVIRLFLPRFEGVAAPGPVAGADAAAERARGAETILVVEDEPQVRRLSVDALTHLGYTVHEAESAGAGLRILDARPEIRLLFTDIVMPDVNGRRFAEEALRRRPDLKVLFTTGYAGDAFAPGGDVDPGVALLIKPFSVEALAAKVREILDQ